jgi:trk system potassium uptake protein TrkH
MLSEDDNSSLRSTVLGIVFTTFLIEGIGALLLFWGFLPTLGFSIKNAYYSIFHAVSAFCNAGFVLYSDGFESFRLNPVVNFTIAFLIILGGISFAVIHNVRLVLKERFTALAKRQRGSFQNDLTLNSRIVLVFAGVLILAGTLLFYILEHDNSMASYGLGEQYLAAFFQSVTLRTAGFNTVPFSNFTVSTYLFMCVFMFIGASSGGTAGGIKVQTVAVIGSAIRSFLRGEKTVTIQNYQIGNDKIRSAFVICLSGLTAVFVAVFVLSLTEKADVLKIMFEVCAAIGTTGISAGITSSLSVTGKIAILLLMFWGRLGAITILSAAAFDKEQVNISYPQADISIG